MEAPPDDETEAELQKLRTSKGTTGFKGVIKAKKEPGVAKPDQARVYDKNKKAQRPIPGLYESAEAAARAAVKFMRGGCQWPDSDGCRQKRGEVSRMHVPCTRIYLTVQLSTLECAQGPKPRIGSTDGKKKWNKGAPLTKQPKMPGIGRGKHPNSKEAWKLGCKQKVIEGPRDSTLPTTVPMPSAVEDITDAGMRAMWEQEQAMDGEAAPEALGS